MNADEKREQDRMENNIGDARRRYELNTGKKFTQKDAAEYFCVSLGTYRNWEQGVGKGLKGKQLKEIADKYDTTVDYLLRLTDSPKISYHAIALDEPKRPDKLDELCELYRSMTDEGRSQLMIYARGLAATYPKNQMDSAEEIA